MFGGSAPQVVTQDLPSPPDVKATVDPKGLADWLQGSAGAMGSAAAQKKAQAAGFNLGQAVAIGSGTPGAGGQGSSIFSGMGRNFFS